MLIKHAEKIGCRTLDGINLLVAQGAVSFKLCTGYDAPVDIMTKALEDKIQ